MSGQGWFIFMGGGEIAGVMDASSSSWDDCYTQGLQPLPWSGRTEGQVELGMRYTPWKPGRWQREA